MRTWQGRSMTHDPPPARAGNVHASSVADLAVAVVLAVAALLAHAHFADDEAASPVQFVLWSFAAAALVRSAVRFAAIELTGPGGR